MVSGGGHDGFALTSDGSVWRWSKHNIGVIVPGLTDVADIAKGNSHYLAMTNSGELWAWGLNDCGQLGDGTTTGSILPIQSGITLFERVATFLYFHEEKYKVDIPGSVTVGASAYDQFGAEMNGEDIKYSLPQVGSRAVTINSSTGVVTVLPSASPGTRIIKASLNGMEDTVELTLSYPRNELDLDITQGDKYHVTLSADAFESFAGVTVTLTYDPAMLQLQNVAEQVNGTHITQGVIADTGITISQISAGAVELIFDATIQQGKIWSGVITVFRFIAVDSGTTTLIVE